MKRTPDRVLQVMPPTPPIRMGAQRRTGGSRLEAARTVFLRVVGVLWFAEGALHWLAVLTAPDGDLLSATAPHVAAMVFFCVLDLVAAVGLWLVSSWGVAVWLATMAGHVAVVVDGGTLPDPVLMLLGDAVLAIAYAALVWGVARERRRA